MTKKHKLYASRLFRRLEQYMKDEELNWRDVAVLLPCDHIQEQSLVRKLKRMRTLRCKPCMFLLMDVADTIEMPYEKLFGKELYE